MQKTEKKGKLYLEIKKQGVPYWAPALTLNSSNPHGYDVHVRDVLRILDEAKQDFPLTPNYNGEDMTEFWAKLATERLEWAEKYFGTIRWKPKYCKI